MNGHDLPKAEVENFRVRNTRGENVSIGLVSFKGLYTWVDEATMSAALDGIADADWDSFLNIVER